MLDLESLSATKYRLLVQEKEGAIIGSLIIVFFILKVTCILIYCIILLVGIVVSPTIKVPERKSRKRIRY